MAVIEGLEEDLKWFNVRGMKCDFVYVCQCRPRRMWNTVTALLYEEHVNYRLLMLEGKKDAIY